MFDLQVDFINIFAETERILFLNPDDIPFGREYFLCPADILLLPDFNQEGAFRHLAVMGDADVFQIDLLKSQQRDNRGKGAGFIRDIHIKT